MTVVAVIAKQCRPGRVKTRLTPPYTPEDAAALAAAALDDTLEAVAGFPADRRVLYFDGEAVPDAAAAFDVVPQPAGDLDVRLAHLFDLIREPLLLLGMDTPQVRLDHVAPALDDRSRVGAWVGPAADGGFWALAMREPDGAMIRGVPMSRDDTGRRQLDRLEAAGLEVGLLDVHTDVDTAASAASVARSAPETRFARLHARLAGGSR
ncbi:TIGR04282 family arsenosugar biosynthesis glycosyltransferase [Agromyces arachidis]|uniref:TIGR04282 family arsenosugar biosynthesis glycosyltransferase n=1 Tax=Agromyces arachidis TaxID=766966 RepID=UPI00405729C1